MITVPMDINISLSQSLYDEMIADLQLSKTTCPCGQTGGLKIHGYYYRTVKDREKTERIRICRVKCKHCNATHSIMPLHIIPYVQIPIREQTDIIDDIADSHHLKTKSIQDNNPSISESNIRSIIRRYKRHWEKICVKSCEEREAKEHKERSIKECEAVKHLLCEGKEHFLAKSISNNLKELISYSFQNFQRQFLQVKLKINILIVFSCF